MKSLFFSLLFCAIFTYSSQSIADITATIVDAPDKTLLYTPLRITAVLENVGNSTEAINLTAGWGFEMLNGTEFVPVPSFFNYDVGEDVVAVLVPGEKYYVSNMSANRWNQFSRMRAIMNCESFFRVQDNAFLHI